MLALELEGRAAIVTGGGSGLGLATARRLADAGCRVTLMGRDEEKLRVAAEGIGPLAGWSGGSVCSEDDVERAVEVASRSTGGLDIAILAAGTGFIAPLAAIEPDRWRAVLDTNLTGAMLSMKHAAHVMSQSDGGSIVAISSLAGERVHRWWAPYCVSKAGLDMLVRCAADELGVAGIRVNSIRPGLVPTDLSAALTQNARVVEDYLDQMPIRRLGSPDDVAALACFLASPEATWITGQCIGVDGGQHLRRGPVLEAELSPVFGKSLSGRHISGSR